LRPGSFKKFALATLISLFTAVTYADGQPQRIISLAPNITEILYELGLEERIVGVTSFCDFPKETKKKQKIGGMSNPSLEAVISLSPDMVVMTTDGNPKEFNERLRSMKIKTYVFRAKRLSELPDGIRDLGTALGIKDRAEKLAKATEAAMNKVRNKKSAGTYKYSITSLQKKKVLFIVWPEPLVAAGPGTVIDDAMALIGVENIASAAKAPYPKYSIEEVIRRSPDAIIIGKGIGMEKVSQGLLKRLKSLPAVINRRLYYVSDDLYRLGPRTIKGIEEISSVMERVQ
jgi:iron complex transport system substrate-binding protein